MHYKDKGDTMFTEEELNKKNLKEVQEIAKNYGI